MGRGYYVSTLNLNERAVAASDAPPNLPKRKFVQTEYKNLRLTPPKRRQPEDKLPSM